MTESENRDFDLTTFGHLGVVSIGINYPRGRPGAIHTVEVNLNDVRAADSVRVTYDFERDGWSILQASTFSWDADDTVCDMDWQEVAFVKAWGRQKSSEDED